MGHDQASADNVYAKYEKSSFKSEKRLWSGHHYTCNLDVTYVGDGTSPDVVVLPSESHPDMVRTAAAVHGPIPACPFDSAVDSLIASRRPRAADAPPPSIEGSDSRSGSRAAVFVGAQVPGTFAGEGSAMDISQAKFDQVPVFITEETAPVNAELEEVRDKGQLLQQMFAEEGVMLTADGSHDIDTPTKRYPEQQLLRGDQARPDRRGARPRPGWRRGGEMWIWDWLPRPSHLAGGTHENAGRCRQHDRAVWPGQGLHQ